MEKSIKKLSVFATAGVLALTTAVYVPTAAVIAADGEGESACAAYSKINNTTTGIFTATEDGQGIKLTGECSYTVETLTDTYLEVQSGAKITLNLTEANITNTANNPIKVLEGGELIITGAPTALTGKSKVVINNAGTLTLDSEAVLPTSAAGIVNTGTANFNGSTSAAVDNSGVLNINAAKVGTLINTGTLTVNGESTISKINVNGGSITINDGAISGAYTQTAGDVTIKGGTFNGQVSQTGGHLYISGGKYAIAAGNTQAAIDDDVIQGYVAYADSDYVYVETPIAGKTITFEDIELTEDVEADFAGAVISGSASPFTYVASDASVTVDAANGKITAATPGTYTITATSVFDNAIEAQANINVTSSLTGVSVKRANNSTITSSPAELTDGAVYNLYNTDSANYKIASLAAGADATFTVAEVVADGEEASGVVTVQYNATNQRFKITGKKSGTADIKVTATSADGEVVKSLTFTVNVYDKIDTINVANTPVYMLVGETISKTDLLSLYGVTATAENDGIANGVDYTFKFADARGRRYAVNEATDEEEQSITALAATAPLGAGAGLTIEATDAANTTVTANVNVKIYAGLDAFTFDGSDDNAVTLTEDDGILPIAFKDFKAGNADFTPTQTEDDEAATAASYKIVEKVVDEATGDFTYEELDDSVLYITDDGKIVAGTLTDAAAASDEDYVEYVAATYYYTLGNRQFSHTEYLAVTIKSELTDVYVLDADDSLVNTEEESLVIKQGQSYDYTIATLSTHADVDHYAVSSSDTEKVKVSLSEDTFTLSALALTEEDAHVTITVKAYDADGNSVVTTFDVEVAAPSVNAIEFDGEDNIFFNTDEQIAGTKIYYAVDIDEGASLAATQIAVIPTGAAIADGIENYFGRLDSDVEFSFGEDEEGTFIRVESAKPGSYYLLMSATDDSGNTVYSSIPAMLMVLDQYAIDGDIEDHTWYQGNKGNLTIYSPEGSYDALEGVYIIKDADLDKQSITVDDLNHYFWHAESADELTDMGFTALAKGTDYTGKNGSTVVTLLNNYLNSLAGNTLYTLALLWDNGNVAFTQLATIAESATDNGSTDNGSTNNGSNSASDSSDSTSSTSAADTSLSSTAITTKASSKHAKKVANTGVATATTDASHLSLIAAAIIATGAAAIAALGFKKKSLKK